MMDRSIETFALRQREEQSETQRKKPNRLIPSGSARGLDAFFEAMNDSYYQEDGEEDVDPDKNLDYRFGAVQRVYWGIDAWNIQSTKWDKKDKDTLFKIVSKYKNKLFKAVENFLRFPTYKSLSSYANDQRLEFDAECKKKKLPIDYRRPFRSLSDPIPDFTYNDLFKRKMELEDDKLVKLFESAKFKDIEKNVKKYETTVLNEYYYQEEDVEAGEETSDDASLDDNMNDTTDTTDDMQGEDTDNKAPVETDGINGTIPEETEDEDTETPTDTPTEENNDDDMSTFGQHGGDDLPNNQYDPAEVAKVMEFVADEAKALSDYLEAAKTSKVDILQRLYSDIADEERYHMEQLLFAKSEITGEEYKPKDPDIRKEYEELLSMGMDEGSAMATAVDKFNLRAVSITKTPDGNIEVENQEIQEAVEEMERGILYMETVQFVMNYCTDDYITGHVMEMATPVIFQEDISATVDMTYSRKLSGFHLLVGAIRGIFKLIMKVARLIRTIVERTKHRIHAVASFVHKHGIEGIFQQGVLLYLWNDKTSQMDIEPLCQFINMTLWLSQEVVRLSQLRNGRYANIVMNIDRLFVTHRPDYQQKPSPMTCFKKLQSLDLVKTKVVVTPQNAAGVADIFFGEFPSDQQYRNGINPQSMSPNGYDMAQFRNCYVILDIISQVASSFTEIIQNLVGELEGLENDERSIYWRQRKTYDNCQEYMKAVTKALSTFTKVISADVATLNNLTDIIQNI